MVKIESKFLIKTILIIAFIFTSPANAEYDDNKVIEIDSHVSAISIFNDTQLAAMSDSGTGTFADPYILTLNVTSSLNATVYISGTTEYFVIKDSSLTGGTWGIIFDNVINGKIINTTIHDNSAGGIKFIDTENSTISNNTIYDNADDGIVFKNSDENLVEDNFIYGHGDVTGTVSALSLNTHAQGHGIWLDPSDDNIFYNNTIYANTHGILGIDSDNATISNNMIHSNEVGIDFNRMTFSNITYNTIINHTIYGMLVNNSHQITIDNNLIENNTIDTYIVDEEITDISIIYINSTITIPTTVPVPTTVPTTVFTAASPIWFNPLFIMIIPLFIKKIKNKKSK